MNNKGKIPVDLLLDYLDGNLGGEESHRVEAAIREDEETRQQFTSLQEVHRLLKQGRLEGPSEQFAQRVMSGLGRYPLQGQALPLNGILLLAAMVVLILVAAFLVPSGEFDAISTIDLNPIGLHWKNTLPVISIPGKMLINAIIVLNIALAFLVFDRTVLKPFFERRENGYKPIN